MGKRKVLGSILKASGEASYQALQGVTKAAGAITYATGKGLYHGGKVVGKGLTKPIKDLSTAPISERLIKRQLNAGGIVALTGATMGVSTVGAMLDNGSVQKKLGDISIGDNLDRLVSIDGSGFVEQANQLSGGDPEIMTDIVKHTFNSPNQFGASGDLVFALHNRREG